MHAKLLAASLVAAVALSGPAIAQKGGRPASKSTTKTTKPSGPKSSPGEKFPSSLSEAREAETRERLEQKLGRRPSEKEVTNEIAREDAATRERLKEWQEKRRQQKQEDRELLEQSADTANILVLAAPAPPPTNFRVRIRRQDGRAFEFTRTEAEAKLRSLRNPEIRSRQEGADAAFSRSFAAFDAAVFSHAHGNLPPPQPLRYLRYDRAAGMLSVFAELPAGSRPEATWKVPPATAEQSLALLEMRVFLRASGRVVCYCSEIPASLRESTADTGIEYVRGAERSANATANQLLSAAILGERRFEPGRAELLDGLPRIRLGLLGLWDTWRMNLNFSDRHEWRKFRREVVIPAHVPARPATARAVIEGLGEGNRDILLVVAHNDGHYLYLPSGDRVPFRDIAALKRESAPDRVVVLITCKGAVSEGGLASVTEMILQNRLARSVFASERLIDARKLPEILDKLSSASSLRSALQQFVFDQYVENFNDRSGYPFETTAFFRSRFPRG